MRAGQTRQLGTLATELRRKATTDGEAAALSGNIVEDRGEIAVGRGEIDETAQGSFFMPLLAGYMMGSMLSGNRYGAAPLYRDASARVFGAGERPYAFQSPGSTVRHSAAAEQPLAAVTKPPPVMTRTMIAERGGFGAARTSAAGRSGFGG